MNVLQSSNIFSLYPKGLHNYSCLNSNTGGFLWVPWLPGPAEGPKDRERFGICTQVRMVSELSAARTRTCDSQAREQVWGCWQPYLESKILSPNTLILGKVQAPSASVS